MNENPDAVPQSESVDMGVAADIRLTSTAEKFLVQTGPWARFMSVMTFISAGFIVIMGMVISILGVGLRTIPLGQGRLGAMGFVPNVVLGLIYILLGILYIAPGVFLWQFASAIRFLKTSRSQQALEDALRNQKSFWRYVGILAIIGLAVGALIFVSAIIAAIFVMRRNF
jgi:hypothetical protein